MLSANMIPAIWVPPAHVRNMRYLLSQRRHLMGMHTQTVKSIQSVGHRHHLKHARGKRFNQKNTKWQQDERLSDSEKFQLELDMTTKQHLAEQAGKITKKLARMSHQKPWADSMLYLMQLPGFGVITDMTVLAAIGDIHGFETSGHRVSYSGLVPAGAKRSETAQQAHHQGRSQGLALGDGRSGATRRQIRSALETPFQCTAKTHAPQPRSGRLARRGETARRSWP